MAEAQAASLDTLWGGRVVLRQAAGGYRAAVDTVLLGASVQVKAGAQIAELGCGAGPALIIAGLANPGARITGVEIDAGAAALARENVSRNGLSDRAVIEVCDVCALPGAWRDRFDHVVANPPYYDDPGAVRPPNDADRARAFVAAGGDITDWVNAATNAVRGRGYVTFVHRADRLPDLLAALTHRCGDLRIRPIHPYADAPAKRVLVRARKGVASPAMLLAPLVLHYRGGEYTPDAEAILGGRAGLTWGGESCRGAIASSRSGHR